MAEFYSVKIGSVYLTRDGTASGRACLLSVSGASDLLQTVSGNVQFAVDGTPIIQTFETGTKGKILEIKVEVLLTAVWASIVGLINAALSDGTTINLVGTGDIGNFDVDCFPLMPRPFEANEFINGRIENAIFRFVSV